MKLIKSLFAMVCVITLFSCNATKSTVATPTAPSAPEPVEIETPKVEMSTPGSITWAAANDRYSAEGKFNNWNISNVNMGGKDISTLTATIEIDLTSIWEKSPKLTDHLKAPDYFDVENNQTATIEIKRVIKGPDTHSAKMSLNMMGKEQSVIGKFKVVTWDPLTVSGSAMVDRSIFGIGVENTNTPNKIKVNFDTVIPR